VSEWNTFKGYAEKSGDFYKKLTKILKVTEGKNEE
jgi:hypothetical protein